MNDTTTNNTTQTLYPTYLTLLPVIPSKAVHIETNEEWMVRHYNKLIIVIMKVIDTNNITYCTDKQYRLITIYRTEDILIYIISSCYKYIFFYFLFFYFLSFVSMIMLLFSLSCLCYILLSNLIYSFFFL